MSRITVRLTWDDIHAAIKNYVADKHPEVTKETAEVYVGFLHHSGTGLNVESAIVTIKPLDDLEIL